MPTIADLTIDLHANVASLRNDLGKATQETQKFAKGVEGAFRGLKNIAASLGIAVGVQQLVSFARGALDAAANIGELAKQLGLSASALQELQFAASQSGVQGGELEAAFIRLTRSIGDAATGSKQAVEAFTRMGVSFVDNTGKARSNEEVFLDIAEAYQNAGDKTAFAAQMADVLGKSASRLIPILEQGADGLAKNAQLARELGLVMSDELVAAADQAADAMEMWSTRIRNYFTIGTFEALKFLGVIQRTREESLNTELHNLEVMRLSTSKGMARAAENGNSEMLKALNNQLLEVEENIRRVRGELDLLKNPVAPAVIGGDGDGGGGGSFGGSSGGGRSGTPDWLKDIREILNDDSWENKNTGVVKFSSLAHEAADETMYFGDAISGLTNDLVAAAQGTTDFKTIFLNNLNSILAGIADGLMGLAGGGSGSSSGGIGGIISGVIGLVGGAFGGGLSADPFPGTTGRASGGPVRGGMPYTVGEDGPELFVPSQSGDIFPNGSGSGGSTIINNFNFQGSTLDQTRVRAQIARAMPQIVRSSEAHLSDSKKRGALPAFR